MSLPNEAEIRDAAQRLELADENGNYRQRDRATIAAAIQAAKAEDDAAEDPETGNTAEILGRFERELFDNQVGPDARARAVGAAAAYLLRTGGLNLRPREETTPS